MSFNRLNYDMCQYKQSINESTAPGNYMLATPSTSCEYKYPKPASIRLQKAGNSINRSMPLIDIDSKLKNRNIPASKCTLESFTDLSNNLTHWPDCFPDTLESRTSNPASNLRGTGFDRWEYLCFNPQTKATIPFANNVSNRIITKDNHKPCLPKLIDNSKSLPKNLNKLSCKKTTPVCSNP